MIKNYKHLLIIIPIIIILVLTYLNRSFYFDDSLIYARYIQNFLNGDGLVYNVGERFNGLTSPIFTYLSVLASLLIKDVLLSINILSGIFFALTIYFSYKIFCEYFNSYFIVGASLLIATNNYFYVIFGMETYLFLFLIVLSIYLYQKSKYFWLLISLTLLVLTRSEGVFLVIPILIFSLKNFKKIITIKNIIIPISILVIHFSFNYIYYSELLPHTGMAKIYQGMSGLWGIQKPLLLFGIGILVNQGFFNSYIFFVSILFISTIGIVYSFKNSTVKIILAFLIMLYLFYSILNIPNYHWYYAPFMYFLFYFVTFGLNFVFNEVDKIRKNIKIVVGILYVPLLLIMIYYQFNSIILSEPNHPYKKIGLWLNQNIAEDASIACIEIGIIGFYSDRQIIDILGLVNHHNAKYLGERKFRKWLHYYSPDYILVHDPLWILENSLKYLSTKRRYSVDSSFNINGFKLYKKNENILLNNLNIKNRSIYDLIEQTNYSTAFTNIQTYGKDKIAFCHVGSEIVLDSSIINRFYDNKIKFGYSIKDIAYQNGNKCKGGNFKIFANFKDKDSLIFSKTLNPFDNINDRGIKIDSIPVFENANEYIFRIENIDDKSKKWGWSYWKYFTDE